MNSIQSNQTQLIDQQTQQISKLNESIKEKEAHFVKEVALKAVAIEGLKLSNEQLASTDKS